MRTQATSKQEGNMIIDREFDPETIQQLKVVPIKELKAFLNARAISTELQTSSQPSKWARLAEEIDNDPDLDDPEFQKAWQHMKKDMQEFREDFSFKHDLT